MHPIMRPRKPQQPRRYCLHCLRDIVGKCITVQEKVSLPGMPKVYATRYLHEECAMELEQEAQED
jgi:hypothetical protein